VPKEITITSQPSELHVLPLPTSGRPADFTGAVGQFKVSSDVSAAQVSAGDPVTLRMHVSGEGNFDRVDTQMLERNEQWKTYPPKSTFAAADSIGHKGEKTFEQPLIASQTGEQTIPSLSFSYFDPETKRYERAATAPLELEVEAARADNSLKAPAPASQSDARLASRTSQDLRPDHAPTAISESLIPLYLRPAFLAIPATLALVFAAGFVALKRAPRRVASKAVEGALARLGELAQSGDASFYVAARDFLLQFDPRLDRDAQQFDRLFALADEAKYGGRAAGGADLAQWLELVRRHLQEPR
jgi:hypothetical protein